MGLDTPTRGLGTDHTGFFCAKCDGNAHAISGPLLPAGAKTHLIFQFAKGAGCPRNQWKEQLVDGEWAARALLSPSPPEPAPSQPLVSWLGTALYST